MSHFCWLLTDGLGSVYSSSGYNFSQVDTADGVWDSSDLASATIVAQTPDQVAVVTYYNPGPYIAVYISNMPEYNGGVNDERFFYNAIVNLWASVLGNGESGLKGSVPAGATSSDPGVGADSAPPRNETGTSP